MWLKLFRTFKVGFQNFYRNGWLSVATIGIIIATLFIITIQYIILSANQLLLNDIKDRVSVSVYFKPTASEADIFSLKDELRQFQEVKEVEYISRDQAFQEFSKRNANNEILKKSLEEIGTNPFEAALNIKVYNPNDYEIIAQSVENGKYKEIISNVNYHKYQNVIQGVNREIKSNRRMGIILGITFTVIAILITFNSIRITMYAHRQEIEIMRLVGASNNYIRMPFVWEGIFYGIIAAAIATPLVLVYLKVIVSGESASGSVLPFSNSIYIAKFLKENFQKNLEIILLLQLGGGALMGVISSLIAIRRYLKV